MVQQKPLLIVSDAVSCGSGFGRIAGDLASRIHANLGDLYRVATAAPTGPGSSKFPFMQYTLDGVREYVLPTLPDIWKDWSRGEKGAICFIWDSSRLGWFAQPELLSDTLTDFPWLRQWLKEPNFEKWIYCPLDAEGPGPNGELTFPLKATLFGFDRIIAYTRWGADVIRRTIGDEEAEKRHLVALPHGIDSDIFFEMPRKACRLAFLTRTGATPVIPTIKAQPIGEDEILIGIVATNQRRKDWSLALKTCALLAKNRKIRVWAHTDRLEAEFSLPALLLDYGLLDKTVVSLTHLTDENMAVAYSACDLTLAPGRGEGFGFPLAESVFCGTPCLHVNYAGGAEVLSGYEDMLINPIAFQDEGEYLCKRPVSSAAQWAERAETLIGKRMNYPGYYSWENVWEQWRSYLTEAASAFSS